MSFRKIKNIYYVVAIGVVFVVINQLALTDPPRSLSSDTRLNDTASKSVFAVINTPKMGTGGLVATALSDSCTRSNIDVDGLAAYDCPDDKTVFRTHKFDIGSSAIKEYRTNNPESQCLIVTAIRNPTSWLASKFLESLGAAKFKPELGGCNLDEWPSKETLLRDFQEYAQLKDSYGALTHALPGLLEEFGGGGIREQYEIMDANDGYSLLGPAPPGSIVEGCNLLFLRMEQSDRWPAIFEQIDPTVEFKKGVARDEQCPNLIEYIKVVTDYEMTEAEKKSIYQKGERFIEDWFDAYGYMNKDPLKDHIIE